MNRETTDERLAPFPIEHLIRVRTRFAVIDWCRGECEPAQRLARRMLLWSLPAIVACAFWPVLFPIGMVLVMLGLVAQARWSVLLDVRRHCSDLNAQDIAELQAGSRVTQDFPAG